MEDSHENNKHIRPPRHVLEWKDISYSVVTTEMGALSLASKKTGILNNVSGKAKSGEIVAILGPSGSGKTSLLGILAGRVSQGHISGTVTLNDESRDKSWRHFCGYVEQQESFQEHLTVRETLLFTAFLRLSRQLPIELRIQRAERLISDLRIGDCANTMIGNCSGGERKRTALGIELVTSPFCLLLDEPSSGLDAFTALSLVESLHTMAVQEHKIVIMTIHQPRAMIMRYISSIILLSQGSVVYQGSLEGALIHFSRQGLHCIGLTAPTDFLLDNIIVDTRTPDLKQSSQRRLDELIVAWKSRESSSSTEVGTAEEKRWLLLYLASCCSSEVDGKFWATRPSLFVQFRLLLLRYLTDFRRYKAALIALTVQTLVLSAFVSAIFWQLGVSQASIQNRMGVTFFVIAQEMFSFTMPVATALPAEKQIIRRERYAVSYRPICVYVAKVLSIIPQATISLLVFGTIVYWCVGLKAEFMAFSIFLLTLTAIVLCSQALGMIVGSLSPNVHVSLILGPLIVLVFVVFGGNTVNTSQVPAFIAWIQYISPAFYAYSALMRNEFQGLTFTCDSVASGAPCFSTGSQVLAYYNLGAFAIWSSILMIFGLCLVFHVVAFFILRMQTRPKAKVL